MAITQIAYTGDGSTVLYTFPFEYIDESEIIVEVNRTVTTAYSLANPTTIQFNTAPANGALILITRSTDIDTTKVIYYPGSAIRAQDLNVNFDQSRLSVQEWRDQKVPYYNAVFPDRIDMDNNPIINVEDPTNAQDAATKNYVDTTTWNVTDETLQAGETWVSSDAYVATSQSIDQRIDDKIDTAITGDIAGSDGVTITDDGDGTITVGLGAGSIDFDRIKDEDIITESEQDAGSPSPTDTNLFTGAASSKRFDTIVSDSTPVGSDWEVGKTWLQQSPDNTLSIWNGTGWIGVASGGTFTTQPTVIYVDSASGNDSFDGHRIINPKRTIKNAVASADAGDVIIVSPGVYQETLPIDITVSNLSIVGQSIRSCFIHPTAATETETMFRCNSGTYITGFTFAGLKASGARGGHPVDSDSSYGLPTNQGWVAGFYPGCVVRKSPYIQNCTNFADSGIDNNNFDPNNFQGTGGDLTSAPTGGGIFVDGSLPSNSSPLRSFVVDSFTQICLDGPGCLVANNGYAQLVSFFGTFCHYHTKALSGGQANLTNSTTDFGRYGLIADGKSTTAIFTATANGSATAGDITFAINQPVDTWFGSATRPLDNMLVQIGSDIYEILSSSSNGLGWNVTISNPDPANRAVNRGLDNGHANGAAISFFLQSFVSTSGHTFEYAGTGTDYRALPQNGGVAIEANQVISRNDGRVWLSSTDQNGKFKVGDTFEVDQRTGFVTIDPQSVATNLVSDLSPQLGADLDVLDRRIYTSLANGDIDLDADGSGLIKVTEFNLSQVPVVTQHDIGTAPNEVPLNGMLGGMAFQDPASVVIDAVTIGVNSSTAADPSLSFDSDTGLYSPGADQVAISTGGSERARLDTSGNILIGGTLPASPNIKLNANGSASFDGSVGIGTSTPQETLQVYGSAPNTDMAHFGRTGGKLRGLIIGTRAAGAVDDAQVLLQAPHPSGSISLWTGNSQRVTVNESGNMYLGDTLPASSNISLNADGSATFAGNIATTGIVFGTPSGSVASKTLDDYEEGTWTPEFTFAIPGDLAVTYPNQVGNYRIVGKLCIATFILEFTPTYTTSSGSARVTGLPLSSGNYLATSASVDRFSGFTLTAGFDNMWLRKSTGVAVVELYSMGRSGSSIMGTSEVVSGFAKKLNGTIIYNL